MSRRHRKNVLMLWHAYDLYQRFREREARNVMMKLIRNVVKEEPNG